LDFLAKTNAWLFAGADLPMFVTKRIIAARKERSSNQTRTFWIAWEERSLAV